MEPDGLGTLLGAVIAALGGIGDPGAATVKINDEARAEVRPLRFAGAGRLIDVHPSQIEALRLEPDHFGTPALFMKFGPEMTEWIAAITAISVGEPMPIFLCGKELMAPVVREPLLAGQVLLTGGLVQDEMSAAMQIIAGQVDCAGQPIPGPSPKPTGGRRKGGRP